MAQYIVILPWLALENAIFVGGFWFKPLDRKNVEEIVGSEMAQTVRVLLNSYVDLKGKPIGICTIALRRNHTVAWDIPPSLWQKLDQAISLLMLSHLSEQRFYEQFSPHMNATMFDAVKHGVSPNVRYFSMEHRRRGMSLVRGGMRYEDERFQQPTQIYGTKCGRINIRLARALTSVKSYDKELWSRIANAIEFYRLAHSEDPQRHWSEACMLAAMSFEKLIGTPKNGTALDLSVEFAKLFKFYVSLRLHDAKRVKPDSDPKHGATQSDWPLHQKWMKELYELRSAKAHHGRDPKKSENWRAEQHIVIAAFAFALAVKLLLVERGLYTLSEEERGACDAFDKLLDSDWGCDWRKPPEWPEILSDAEQSRGIRAAIERALRDAENSDGHSPHGQANITRET